MLKSIKLVFLLSAALVLFCIFTFILFGPAIKYANLPSRPLGLSAQKMPASSSPEKKDIFEEISRQNRVLKEADEFGISWVTDSAEGEKFIQRIRHNINLQKALKTTKEKAGILYIHRGKLYLPWSEAVESIALTENDDEIIKFLLSHR
ncbi:MAG: hypothetical protein ABR875_01525 [Minisyncoccia bacterium]|jgi:hypothetical protein